MVKGVIITAGYGTRFLPVTKTIPKELLPLVNIPPIEFVVREFIDSGIKDILLVTSRRKKSIEDYFDFDFELETVLHREKAIKKLERMQWSNNVTLHSVRQKEMRGTAHAILQAREFVDDSPFVVAYPDDIFIGNPPVAKQLMAVYERTKCTVISVRKVPLQMTPRFGMIKATFGKEIQVHDIIEKPKMEEAPSNYASLGRYLFTPEIFALFEKIIANQPAGEVFQTDGLQILAKRGELYACEIQGMYLDTGAPIDYVKSVISYALTLPEMHDDILSFLKNKIAEEK